ncbi:MAG: TetR/AcrR family transcriptional regulator [Anaerolineaceae bacterium]|nr:TetR/AcrR family transcriptional regulator [Anaerolineaceae bacterium]
MPKDTFFRLDENKQERVMRSAVDEFQKNGFEHAKVGNIAKKAGIAKGSIYQYFEDKIDFFQYTVLWAHKYFLHHQNQQTLILKMDIFEYLLINNKQRIELMKQEPVMAKLLLDVYLGKYNELTQEIDEEIRHGGNADLLRMIQTGKAKGTIRQDVEDDILALFYQGVIRKTDEMILSMLNNVDIGLDELLEMNIRNFMKLIRTGMSS